MSGALYIGRGNTASPATDFFPFSAASASSPTITVTATTGTGGGTTIHTGDANAQDVLFVTISNVSASALTAYSNLGSLASTGSVQTSLNPGDAKVVFNGNTTISKSGIYGVWTTATTGLVVFGYVARTYTATS